MRIAHPVPRTPAVTHGDFAPREPDIPDPHPQRLHRTQAADIHSAINTSVPHMLEWRRLKAALFAHDGVVYAKQPLGGPEQVLEYLGRSTHRVAISNERLVAVDERDVAFRVRAEGAGKRRTLRLAGQEFVRRFLLHVLPTGFKRIRHYGLLAPSRKALRLAAARAALGVPPPDPAVVEPIAHFMRRVARFDVAACPCWRVGRMVTSGPLPASRPTPAVPRAPP